MLKVTVAGIDVSSRKLDVAALFDDSRRETATFANDSTGHIALCRWLTRGQRSARVVVESTGIYSLDLAIALYRSDDISVMVANPRALKDFSRASMNRSKNDRIDAASTLEFALRMPFVPWHAPAPEILELRAISRRIHDLTLETTREKNRLSAARASELVSRIVANDIEVNLRHLERRSDLLLEQALRLIQEHPKLLRALQLLISIKGIAETSAVQLLPELLILPEGMTPRQWVAHAGLDPREFESGSSIKKPTRISKVGNSAIRRALYMPALVAKQHDPHVGAFYEELIQRGKAPLQALVAIMRKLLHAIHGMLRSGQTWQGERFRALKTP